MASTSRSSWTAPVVRVDETGEAVTGRRVQIDPDLGAPDPYADEPKWAAWKVTLVVVVFCGAFWAGISYLAVRLLG